MGEAACVLVTDSVVRGDVIALNIEIAFFCFVTPYCLVYM